MVKQLFVIAAVCLFIMSCGKKDDDVYTINGPSGVPVANIIKIISVAPLQTPADNITPVSMSVQIDPGTDSIHRTVVFSTDKGTFANGTTADTVRADAYGMAQSKFTSNAIGKTTVSARAGDFRIDTVVTFTAALPDELLLTADKYEGEDTDSFNIVVTAKRIGGRGVVSDPINIGFSQSPVGSGNNTLVFPGFTTTTNGSSTIAVRNPYKINGTFGIIATTSTDGGSNITQSITLVIKASQP